MFIKLFFYSRRSFFLGFYFSILELGLSCTLCILRIMLLVKSVLLCFICMLEDVWSNGHLTIPSLVLLLGLVGGSLLCVCPTYLICYC